MIGKICETHNIPLITINQYGLVGMIRMYVKELCVIESKPSDVEITDLRIADCFKELEVTFQNH